MVLSVLLKDTSVTASQAGIRTHIPTTSELESNALDRSATTLHKQTPKCTINRKFNQAMFYACLLHWLNWCTHGRRSHTSLDSHNTNVRWLDWPQFTSGGLDRPVRDRIKGS